MKRYIRDTPVTVARCRLQFAEDQQRAINRAMSQLFPGRNSAHGFEKAPVDNTGRHKLDRFLVDLEQLTRLNFLFAIDPVYAPEMDPGLYPEPAFAVAETVPGSFAVELTTERDRLIAFLASMFIVSGRAGPSLRLAGDIEVRQEDLQRVLTETRRAFVSSVEYLSRFWRVSTPLHDEEDRPITVEAFVEDLRGIAGEAAG